MPAIEVNFAGDNSWPELAENYLAIFVLPGETKWKLAAIERGMSSGAPSVALRFDFERGAAARASTLIAETSLAAWIAATCALRGRFPEAFAGTPLEDRSRDG